jgi:hypothetical protein
MSTPHIHRRQKPIFQSQVIPFEYLLLGVITLLGAGLRFYRLGDWSFWGDEIFTIGTLDDGFNFNLFRQSLATALIHQITAWLGVSEWTARLVPAIIGILSIPIFYFLCKRLFGSPVALFAGLLIALSPWHIYWSQNARFYSLLLLFYTIGLFLFMIGLEEDKPWVLLVALIFFGLAARERLLALLFLPVVIAYLLLLKILPIEKPRGLNRRNLAIFFIPGLFGGLLFAAPYLRNLAGWLVAFGRIDNTTFWLVSGVIYYVSLPVVCLGSIGAFFSFTRCPRVVLFLFLGAVIPLVAVAALSTFQKTGNRYVFISLTSWLALASLTVRDLFDLLRGSAKSIAVGVAALVVLTALGEIVLYYGYQNGNRENWRAAFAYIQEHKTDTDLIVSANPNIGKYYLGKRPLGFPSFDPARLDGRSRIWIIQDNTTEIIYPQVVRWFETNAQPVANFDVHAHARNFKIRVYLYTPEGLERFERTKAIPRMGIREGSRWKYLSQPT